MPAKQAVSRNGSRVPESSLLKDADFSTVSHKSSAFWKKERRRRSLALFRAAADSVPAYKRFLRREGVAAERVKTWEDFQKIPAITKQDYLKKYPLEDICWNGNLKKPLVFTATSGSTGTPFYFMRGHDIDWQYSILIEDFLKHAVKKQDDPVLVVICFGMGVWIGGLITYKAFEIAAQRTGASVSIITPGINKKEIFNALRNLAPHYKHTMLIGYPPFIKDIIDEAAGEGVNVKKLNLKLIFAAEAFTENFRDYLIEKTGIKNACTDTMNIYGTADIGAMAYETPLSIFIRRTALKHPELFTDIFGSINKTPTLAQFNPLFINFECVNGDIILTGDNEVPLVRYDLGDHGGVYSHDEMAAIFRRHNLDLRQELKRAGLEKFFNELPFVFVFERKDFSVTLYGLQIYPEVIRDTILENPFNGYLSGKFTMLTQFSKKHDQYLQINIELKKGIEGVPAELKKRLLKKVVADLRQKNSEFRELSDHLKRRANPALVFWPHESAEYFKPGVKQQWVTK